MDNVVEFVRRAVEKMGLVREKYVEGNLPTTFGSFLAIPFFGDKKHEFVLASLLLNRLKERANKYVIVVGWPQHAGLFTAGGRILECSARRGKIDDAASAGLGQ